MDSGRMMEYLERTHRCKLHTKGPSQYWNQEPSWCGAMKANHHSTMQPFNTDIFYVI